jgi:hypothetical protein
MKKFILPIFILVVLFSSYALGTVAHWIKLDDGEKSFVTRKEHLSYDDVVKLNKKGGFKDQIDPEKNNTYVEKVEITRKKGIFGWDSEEKVLERYIKSIEE